MRRALGIAVVFVLVSVTAATAYQSGPIVDASAGTSPLSGCVAADGGPGTLYPNTEVEPWLAVNPRTPSNVVGTWQQDRWSSGAARGSTVGVSTNGGSTFQSIPVPGQSACTGNPRFTRASDPWVTFSPNGTLYQMSLVETKLSTGVNNPSGMAVNRSTDGGLHWGPTILLADDTDPTLFNDKNSMTADPYDSSYVYAVWDRLDSPPGKGSLKSAENTSGYRGPTFFTRTTNGGTSWEPARAIFNLGTNDQTIGNQIVVLPDRGHTLVDLFDLIRNDNKGNIKGYNVAVITSADHGATWSSKATIVSALNFVQVVDPDTGKAIRTGDIIPEVSVDPISGALYAVWQDGRFAAGHAHVAFSMSSDGGSTWSAPVRIDRAPLVADAFTPSIAVASDGTVGVAYYDLRANDTLPGLPTSYWFTSCAGACTSPSSWSEVPVGGTFDMEKAPIARGYFLGDYEGIATSDRDFLLLYAVAGTSANSADVRFTRLTP